MVLKRDGLASLLQERPEYQASMVMVPPSEPLPFFAVLSSFAGAAAAAAGFFFGVFAMTFERGWNWLHVHPAHPAAPRFSRPSTDSLSLPRETGGDETTPEGDGDEYIPFPPVSLNPVAESGSRACRLLREGQPESTQRPLLRCC